MNRKDTFIIDAVRTPIGNFGGSLSIIRTDDLAAHVIRSLISRQDFDPKIIKLALGKKKGKDKDAYLGEVWEIKEKLNKLLNKSSNTRKRKKKSNKKDKATKKRG